MLISLMTFIAASRIRVTVEENLISSKIDDEVKVYWYNFWGKRVQAYAIFAYDLIKGLLQIEK